jgi:phage terminase large subunit GpA-like protein
MEVTVKKSDIDFLIERFARLPERREYERPSEYIQRVRYIDRSLSPFPGKFSYDKFPYFKEIVDNLSPESPAKYIFVMKGNQCGYTTGVLEPGMMYFIGSDPEEQALFLPDDGMVRRYSETKLENCIDNCGLRERITSTSKKAKGARTTGDTVFHKQYPGGNLRLFGSKSGTRFRNFSFKVIFADEADAALMTLKGEGDIFTLMKARQDAFGSHSKLVIGSTPKNEGSSLIHSLFLTGTQKYFYMDNSEN